ncbi:MAG: hypothetical protein NC343_05460 [Muribaculum sp.]|nr:hypothetical protein [Muribaculaceae bacterium]MCM1081178.1 hypothetical protein [Muribaculum sp.]
MMILFIIAIIMAVASLLLSCRPYVPAYIVAYASLWVLRWSDMAHPGNWLLASWGIVVAIMLAIELAQPKALTKATNGLVYMSVGALAGTMVGLCAATYLWMVVGAAVGTLFGTLVYMRTPAGEALGFASPQFFRYVPAKFFPTVITYCLLGIFVLLLLMRFAPATALNQMP